MRINKRKLTAICAVSLLCTSLSYAERSGFYTIIGPDGRVMVIDRTATDSKKPNPVRPRAAQAAPTPAKTNNSSVNSVNSVNNANASNTSGSQAAAVQPSPSETNNNAPSSSTHSTRQAASSAVAPSTIAPSKQAQAASKSLSKNITDHKKTDNANLPDAASVFVPKRTDPLEPVLAATMPSTAQPASAESSENPVTIIDGEKYIDSEYLEQREFNLEGKKRFYSLPDGMGRAQVVEREKGVDMTAFKPSTIEKPQIVSLSKDYQRLAKDDVVNLIGMQCFSQKQLKKTKLMNKAEPLNLWPRPGLEPKFDIVVAEFQEQINDIQVTSYTDNISNPAFYWPLPIFLDAKGCVIEGVNSFYQQTIAPTVTTQQAIQGYLHIPADTKYMVLTPLEAAADLMQIQLTNKGQVRLTPIR